MSNEGSRGEKPVGWAILADPTRYSLVGPTYAGFTHTPQQSLDPMPQVREVQLAGPPLVGSQRGAILHVDGHFGGGSAIELVAEIRGFDTDIIRASLLLFDKLDFPTSSGFCFNGIPEDLLHFDMAQSTRTIIGGVSNLRIVQEPIVQAFDKLNSRDQGRWALTRSINGLQFPNSAFAPEKAVALTLYDALPVPTAEVPYEDVLNFKQRRSAELDALRLFLDELGLQASQGIGGLAETVAYQKFDVALADYNKAIGEQNFAKRLRNVTTNFQMGDAIVGAGIGAIKNLTSELTATSAIAGGAWGVASSLAMAITRGLRSNNMAGKPFEYIFHANKELGHP